jgi:hypothetical protein
MARQQNPPLHRDRSRGPMNFTLIFALVVAVYGLVSLRLGRDDGVLIVVGLGVAIFNWLTTPRQYEIYQDALVIAYGRPRVRVIPFERISGSPELLRLVIGDRLRLQLVNGKRVIFQTRDLQTFHDRLVEALSGFRRDHPPVESSNQGPGGQGPS